MDIISSQKGTPSMNKLLIENYPDTLDFDKPETILPLFDMDEIADGIEKKVLPAEKQIYFSATINGTPFSLTVDLAGAEGHTKPWQIVIAAKLFWYCYPQMYARFATENSPKDVILLIENFDYEIACAWENKVHIHDQWLKKCPTDFDCLTHEFAHTVQSDWQDEFMPFFEDDSYMVERFADFCRYLYAFKDGKFNDTDWEIQTIESETNYHDSVRFWVWLDYTYSTPEVDIYKNINAQILSGKYTVADWAPDGIAYQDALKGTAAYGKDILTLWDEFAATEMAHLSSAVEKSGDVSPLLKAVPLRDAVRARYADSRTYLKV